MNQDAWSRVDAYLVDALIAHDPVLEAVLAVNAEAGLPAHDVSPTQGRFLNLLVRISGARRVLEIGTLGAYSSIWMARALPEDGELVTLEADPRHAEVARGNIARAGLERRITLLEGAALDTLPTLSGPFDLIFIDADKPSNPAYLAWSLTLSRPGTVIIGDNVVRDGAITDPANPDPRVEGVRRFFADMAATPRLTATALQTVGSKGWDGFSMAVVD